MNARAQLFAAAVACLGLGACVQLPEAGHRQLVRRSQPLLGTFVTITAYGNHRDRVHAALTAAFDEIRRVDALMSVHRVDSDLSRLNASGSTAPVAVPPELLRVIAAAAEVSRETDGAFDATVRPLVELWGFLWKNPRLPTTNELARVLPLMGYEQVRLDRAARTVRFARPGVSLDLGGIAKGFAVDCAVEKLRALGITNAMVKAGGDLRVIGLPPGADHWEIQLEDPIKENHRVKVRLKSGALSTSGNYENFLDLDGRRFSHILNPRTGIPVEGVASCTVVAPTCMESDVWATALFVLGPDEALRRFGRRFGFRFVLTSKGHSRDWPVVNSPSFPRGD